MDSKRDTIKEVAMRLFARNGIDAVSVRDIAAECNMQAANLYSHFKSKENLIVELFLEGYQLYGREISFCFESKQNFINGLECMIHRICELHDKDPDLFRFLLLTQHSCLRDIQKQDEYNPINQICQQVSKAMSMGEIAQSQPNLVAAALTGVIVQTATFILYGRILSSMQSMAGEIAELCLKIVQPRSISHA